MNKQNPVDLEKEVEKKYKGKDKRKKRTMKISGAGVRGLARIIKEKNMKNILIFLFLAGFLAACPVYAQEKIDNYDVTITIEDNAKISITEQIAYDFGQIAKHGIYRDIRYNYEARGGNYNLKLSDIKVTDSQGIAHPFTVSKEGRYERIKVGDADKFVNGQMTYAISYTVERAINYFSDHDELYWNVIGNEWDVPIAQAKATINLPDNFYADQVKAECLAGAAEGDNKCVSTRFLYSGENLVNGFVFANDRLEPREGLTIVLGWPKGGVTEPSFYQKILATAVDNLIVILPVAVFALFFYLWRTRGRDPRGRGTIIAEFDAPDDLTPAEVGTIIDEKAQNKDISAAIIQLAVRGYLKIKQVDSHGIILKKDDYELIKLKPGNDLENKFELLLFDAFFSGRGTTVRLSDLKEKFYKDLAKITEQVYRSVVEKGYFAKNPKTVRTAYSVAGVIIMFLSWFVGPIYGAIGVISLIISGLIVIIFGYFMPARTRKGVLAREHILGLKEYLRVAEKDRIKFHNAPEKKPEQFEKLLPYAMVLGVENEWAKQFTDIYDREPSWYEGKSGAHLSALTLISGLDSFQTRANADLSSRPSSAAGGGSGFSGGHVGGGFGGGGGGSW